jgi:hypothetical protein
MAMEARSKLTIMFWDEVTSQEINLTQRITRTDVTFKVEGDLNGIARVNWNMYYNYFNEQHRESSIASYLGLIRFEGNVQGRNGSFVMEDEGTFINGSAESILSIVEFSGLDELMNISGTGKFVSNVEGSYMELDFHFNEPKFNQMQESGSELLN